MEMITEVVKKGLLLDILNDSDIKLKPSSIEFIEIVKIGKDKELIEWLESNMGSFDHASISKACMGILDEILEEVIKNSPGSHFIEVDIKNQKNKNMEVTYEKNKI